MKIELKRFTTNARLSQETTAFAADVWVDGIKVGHAENAGHGGNTLVQLPVGLRSAVEDFTKPFVPAEHKFINSTEYYIDILVEAELQKRHDAATAKKLAKIDVKQKIACEERGLRAARFRCFQTWSWFGFRPQSDPQILAKAMAIKENGVVDELVLL